MPSIIYLAPAQSFLQKTLNGAINDSATTITLSSTTNLQAPGTIVIDRVDSSGAATTSLREIVAFTGIAGNDITGCDRGFDGSTAQSHGDGAIIETTLTAAQYNALATIVSSGFNGDGYLKAIVSPVSISSLFINTRLDVSAASVTGVGLFPVWRGTGAYSGPTIGIGGILTAPKVATWSWISIKTRTVASQASVVFDLMNNGTSIFAGVTKPTIPGGGTYVSTASINTKAISPGQDLRADINAIASGVGVVTDVTIQGGTL